MYGALAGISGSGSASPLRRSRFHQLQAEPSQKPSSV
jgi:hypothetical protein